MTRIISRFLLFIFVVVAFSSCANNKVKIVDPPAKKLVKKKVIYVREKPSATKIYNIVDKRPVFQGGDDKVGSYLSNHLKYPAEAKKAKIQGVVRVRFVVNARGKVEKAEIVKSLSPECDAEVLRVVRGFPTFTPGKLDGVAVKVELVYPIKFEYKK